MLPLLPPLAACNGDPHGHEDLWNQEECQSPSAEYYLDGSEVIGCVRNIKKQIEDHDGVRATFNPKTGGIDFIQTEDKDGRLGPEEHDMSTALKASDTKGLDDAFEAFREKYPKGTDPKKHWIVDQLEGPVRWTSNELIDHHLETINERLVIPFDINHDGYMDPSDDLNGDNRVTREDWKLSQKKKD